MKNRINLMLLYVTGAMLFLSNSTYAQLQLLKPSGQALPGKTTQLSNQDQSVLLNIRSKAKGGQANIFNFDQMALQKNNLWITLPSGEKVEAILTEKDLRTEDDFTWHGYLQGRAGSVTINYQNGQMAGNLVLGNKNYSFAPLGKGASVVYENKDLKYAREYTSNTFGTIQNSQETFSTTEHKGAIRLLVAFTPSAEKEIQALGYQNPKLFIQQFISEINQDYILRGLDHRVTLAVSLPLVYSESGNLNQDLDRFENATDGFMDDIYTYRKLYNADISMLLTKNLKLSDLAPGMQSKENSAFCVVNYDFTQSNNFLAKEIGRLHTNNVEALNHSTDVNTISSAAPEVLHLNNAANLPDKAAGFVTATSEIVLEPGFEVSENSDLRLEVTPSLAPVSSATARIGKVSEKELIDTEILNESVLNIGPVPTHEKLDIEVNFSKETLAAINIYDGRGALIKDVYKGKLTHKRFTVDLSRHSQGLYIVNCRANGQTISKRTALVK